MLVIAGVAALIGLKKIKSIQKPKQTIDSVRELKTVVPNSNSVSASAEGTPGLYT